MTSFSIDTLGCKVNQYESQQIRELLERLGLHQVRSSEEADLVFVNTCCVTHSASAKSRQYIHRAQKANPGATVVVGGCLPIVPTGELKNPDNSVHLIRHRDDLTAVLSAAAKIKSGAPYAKRLRSCPGNNIVPENGRKIKHKKELSLEDDLPQITSFKGHTRAFLKVQDGCDAFCTYCIVPKTRPFVHSKPVEAVLVEAAALVEAGHKEIVVTGIFLGAYGLESARRGKWPGGQNDQLADLLDKMAVIPGLERIRLSSLAPGDVTGRLLDTFVRHSNIMPHLHVSVQSGSDAVLRRMCRQYRADDFRAKLELIKSRLDRPAITTDLIVGFPGETDGDFEQTVRLAKEAGFAKMHVFSFSPRQGTVAAGMQGAVDAEVMKERSGILHGLNLELGRGFREQFIGETAEILVEDADLRAGGRSERYFMLYLKDVGGVVRKNTLVKVKLVGNREDGAVGERIS